MGRHKLWHEHPKVVRDSLNRAEEIALEMHQMETKLVELLGVIDEKRYFVRYGYKALRPFCVEYLKFTRVQAQRLVTRVSRPRVDMSHHENDQRSQGLPGRSD